MKSSVIEKSHCEASVAEINQTSVDDGWVGVRMRMRMMMMMRMMRMMMMMLTQAVSFEKVRVVDSG